MEIRKLQLEHGPASGTPEATPGLTADLTPELTRRGMDLQQALRNVLLRWDTEKAALVGISLLIAYTAVKNIFAAASRPFWYDEILTVSVAHQPSLSAVWSALMRAKDSSPILYILVEHLSAMLVSNQQIAYRLPSIVGFACVLWSLFVFIRRHEGGVCALLCSALLVLTPLYKVYAIEARSYLLAVACVSIALVCYQRVPRRPWVVLLGLALAGAEAFHYYAFFSFLGFFLAEAAWTARAKKIRWGVWLAVVAGSLPLLVSMPLLMEVKRFYGTTFWGKPTFKVVELAYDGFFPAVIVRAVPWLGFIFVAALAAAAVWTGRVFKAPNGATESSKVSYEPLLAVGLLATPFVAFAAAIIGHGTLTSRYLISMVLGLAIAASYLLRLLRRRELVLSVLTVLLLVGVGRQEMLFWTGEHRDLVGVSSPAKSLPALLTSAGQTDTPVVISRGITFLELAYYAPADLATRLVGIVDAPNAVKYSGTDSVDRQMSVLPCCLPIHVYRFRSFAKAHSSFLMYSDANFDWWPVRLRKDGYSLELIGSDQSHNLYRVDRSPVSQ